MERIINYFDQLTLIAKLILVVVVLVVVLVVVPAAVTTVMLLLGCGVCGGCGLLFIVV